MKSRWLARVATGNPATGAETALREMLSFFILP